MRVRKFALTSHELHQALAEFVSRTRNVNFIAPMQVKIEFEGQSVTVEVTEQASQAQS